MFKKFFGSSRKKPTDEFTSVQLTADTVLLDLLFDKILKSSIEAKNPEDGAGFINDLKQQYSMLYGNSVTA